MSILASWRSGRQVARRLGWGVTDQAVSSLENFLLGVYVARTMGPAVFGALAVALAAYAIALNCSRALSTDPLMVRFSNASTESWRRAAASSSGVAVLVGVAGGLVCAGIGLTLHGYAHDAVAGDAFLALAVVLPGLTLQDSWRYAFFAAGDGAKTFVNDVVWTVSLLAALLVGRFAGLTGVTWVVLAFGGTALLAGLFGMIQARTLPTFRDSTSWLRRHRDLGPRFFVENVVLGTGGQFRSLIVAATVGIVAVAGIRGAEMLIGPVTALLMGVAQVAVPEAARALRGGGGRLLRLSLGLSTGLASVAFAWGAVILVAFPFGIGELLLGAVWSDAYPLALGVIVSATAGCMHVGPSAGLRALGRADKTMRCQLATTFVVIALGAAGALAWGAPGAVWGTAAAQVVGAGIWWRALADARREHRTEEAAEPLAEYAMQADPSGGR